MASTPSAPNQLPTSVTKATDTTADITPNNGTSSTIQTFGSRLLSMFNHNHVGPTTSSSTSTMAEAAVADTEMTEVPPQEEAATVVVAAVEHQEGATTSVVGTPEEDLEDDDVDMPLVSLKRKKNSSTSLSAEKKKKTGTATVAVPAPKKLATTQGRFIQTNGFVEPPSSSDDDDDDVDVVLAAAVRNKVANQKSVSKKLTKKQKEEALNNKREATLNGKKKRTTKTPRSVLKSPPPTSAAAATMSTTPSPDAATMRSTTPPVTNPAVAIAATMSATPSPDAGTMRSTVDPSTNVTTTPMATNVTTTPMATLTTAAARVTNTNAERNKRPTKTPKGTGTVISTSQGKTKPRAHQIKVGRRVSVFRQRLVTFCVHDCQRACIPRLDPNNASYYGTNLGGSATTGYNIQFDILPAGFDCITVRKRANLHVLGPNEDEPLLDEDRIAEMEERARIADEAGKSKETKSEDRFVKMGADAIKEALTYELEVNSKETVVWKILPDGHHVTHDLAYTKIKQSQPKLTHIDDNKTPHENFFEHVWPNMEGSAALIDKYLSDPRADYYHTATDKKIKFHDETAADPDWKAKNCVLALVAAGSEMESGMNCWKSGKGLGRKYYPDFGQWVSEKEMKCFISCAAYIWADEKWWYSDKRDIDWDAFMPTVDKWNMTRTKLCVTFLLMMDETMSGWKPKNSKRGGLPNISFEPRKPVPLGTMFRDSSECMTGILMYIDPVMCPERQWMKEHAKTVDPTPRKCSRTQEEVPQHVSEVLRQVQNSGVEVGGWTGGDAWFGSVCACVTLKRELEVESTFIVKHQKDLFPKRPLQAVMDARHGTKPAGHWVVMTTEISGVKLLAICFAWSQSSTAFFISTVGTTQPAETSYQSSFENERGEVVTKLIQRPDICDFLYRFLPVIDNHNKSRQHLLKLERKWPTRNCWFRLYCTLVGLSVVDLYRLYRHKDYDKWEDVTITQFADLICVGLIKRERRTLPEGLRTGAAGSKQVTRIKDGTTGSTTKQVTRKQRRGAHSRDEVGSAIQKTCWVCRMYTPVKKYTSFECVVCGIPMCKPSNKEFDKNDYPERRGWKNCLSEHLHTNTDAARCHLGMRNRIPQELKRYGA